MIADHQVGYCVGTLAGNCKTVMWKYLHSAAGRFLCEEEPSAHFLLDVIRLSEDPTLATAALQLVCSVSLSAQEQQIFGGAQAGIFLPSVAPFIIENICFKSNRDRFSNRGAAGSAIGVLARMGSTVCLSWLFDLEFDPRNLTSLSVDGIMKQVTANSLIALGAAKVAARLLELLPAEDVDRIVESDNHERILAEIAMKGVSNEKGLPLLRAGALLMLHLRGAFNEMLSCLGVEGMSLAEDILIKSMVACPNPEKIPRVLQVFQSDGRTPRARLQAAWILHKCGQELATYRDVLEKIGGYPLPWMQPVALPEGPRKDILRRYAPIAERGTDIALLIEAAILAPSTFVYHDVENEVQTFNGVQISGPTNENDPALSSYVCYSIEVQPATVYPEGRMPHGAVPIIFHIALPQLTIALPETVVNAWAKLSVCTFGPWAFIGASTQEYATTEPIPEPDESLPMYMEATVVLARFAEQLGYTLVPENLRRTAFPGLLVYSFGERKVLSIGELLFFWQD